MKIAFPTLNGTSITAHFGRARGYIVVTLEDDTETGRELRLIESGEPGDQQDPEHHQRHAGLVDTIRDCDAVVAGGMGHPIQERLQAAGLDVILTGIRSIDDAVAAFAAGTLDHDPDRAHAHGGDHHHH